MTKPNFYHLTEEKQQRIEEAIYREFSEYGYEQASINRMIKEAKISRGAFYLYFEDKKDAFHHMLTVTFINPLKEEMGKVVPQKYNILDYTAVCFQALYPLLLQHQTFSTVWLNEVSFLEWNWFIQKLKEEKIYQWERTKLDTLRFRSKYEQQEIFFLLSSVLFHQLQRNLMEKKTPELAKTDLLKSLLILKVGFQR